MQQEQMLIHREVLIARQRASGHTLTRSRRKAAALIREGAVTHWLASPDLLPSHQQFAVAPDPTSVSAREAKLQTSGQLGGSNAWSRSAQRPAVKADAINGYIRRRIHRLASIAPAPVASSRIVKHCCRFGSSSAGRTYVLLHHVLHASFPHSKYTYIHKYTPRYIHILELARFRGRSTPFPQHHSDFLGSSQAWVDPDRGLKTRPPQSSGLACGV